MFLVRKICWYVLLFFFIEVWWCEECWLCLFNSTVNWATKLSIIHGCLIGILILMCNNHIYNMGSFWSLYKLKNWGHLITALVNWRHVRKDRASCASKYLILDSFKVAWNMIHKCTKYPFLPEISRTLYNPYKGSFLPKAVSLSTEISGPSNQKLG